MPVPSTPDLTGVWVTTVTPYDGSGRVDADAIAAHAAFLASSGVTKLVPVGNTGEAFSLGHDESLEVIRATRAGAPDVLVVPGVGGTLDAARALARDALDAGADGVMIHHPSHTFVGARGLERYYRTLIEDVGGRALIYKRGPEVPDALLVRLLEERAAWGVKYAVNDLIAFDQARRSVPDGVWLCGTAELWAPFFALVGACGFTSGIANVAPDLALATHGALADRDFVRAAELRALAAPFEELRAEERAAKNVPAVRAACELAGFHVGPPRPPLAPLDDADLGRVRAIYAGWREAGFAAAAIPTAAAR